MKESLLAKVEKKLNEAFSEIWPNRPEIKAVLDDNTHYNATKEGLEGGVSYLSYSKRQAEWILIHHEPMHLLQNEEAIDDWVAKGLSTLLMLHTRWPK